MPDIPSVKVVGRFGLTVADGADPDQLPDTMWCDEGTVRLVPANTYTKVAGGSPSPWTAGHSVIDVPVDSEGYLSWSGAQHIWVLDLTSESVNPRVADNKATHTVQFRGLKSQGYAVSFPEMTVRLAADTVDPETGACDLTLLTPVPTAGGTPIVVGPRGEQGVQGEPGPKGEPGGSDAAFAGWVESTGTATRAALDAGYVMSRAPRVSGRAAGLQYDGTDESATLQAIIDELATHGSGELTLEGMVRCDSQITFPTMGSSAQPRQAPIRITGAAQHMPGSTFNAAAPYPDTPGLDLRYAGRADAGCSTTKGSGIVGNAAAVAGDRGQIVTGPGIADWTFILAVSPGVGWTLSKPARATGSATLRSYGGRIQTLGYGNLEIDHLRLTSLGGTTSAPFILSTGTKLDIHRNVFIGQEGKSDSTCDEDPVMLGGSGQGTMLTTALTQGQTYTTLSVAPLPTAILESAQLTINPGTPSEQIVVVPSGASQGATSITVTSFVAAAAQPVRTGVYVGGWQVQATDGAWSVPAGLFQGYGTRIHDNHFHRVRRIAVGGFATSYSIDHNSWMHNCGSNIAVPPSTLTTALTRGATVTSLAVTALQAAVIAGDVIQVGIGATSQEFVAAADAASGATAVSVTSATAKAAFAVGAKVINSTAGIDAAVVSFAIPGSVNALNLSFNRVGLSGGYSYVARLLGPTQHSVIIGNDIQDSHHNARSLGAYRFDREAQFNTVIPSLPGAGKTEMPTWDDWSSSDHSPSQTVLEHDQARATQLPQGLDTVGAFARYLPAPGDPNTYGPEYIQSTGQRWRNRAEGDGFWFAHTSAAGVQTDAFQFELNAGVNANLRLMGSNEGRILNELGHISLRSRAGYRVYIGDETNPTGAYVVNGRVHAVAVVGAAYATGSRPTGWGASEKGAQVFDSTLGKPIWWSGSGWVDATGATA